tara:strand:- start:699 stop:932 length:234 start_codon:yes stop_codon:yes gene_type:complete
MNTKKRKYLKLIIDNTKQGKIKDLLKKQNKLIKGKIQLQKESKIINKLLKKYEDHIILLENKINKYREEDNVNRNIK